MRKQMESKIENLRELEFAIFCIENIAKQLEAEPQYVYEALTKKSSLLFSYIVANYEILHTQDKEYIIGDILRVMQEEGVKI